MIVWRLDYQNSTTNYHVYIGSFPSSNEDFPNIVRLWKFKETPDEKPAAYLRLDGELNK